LVIDGVDVGRIIRGETSVISQWRTNQETRRERQENRFVSLMAVDGMEKKVVRRRLGMCRDIVKSGMRSTRFA